MNNVISLEYEAFKRLTDGLEMAADGARAVARCRPDQSAQWLKMAEAYGVAREAAFRLAGTGVIGGAQ